MAFIPDRDKPKEQRKEGPTVNVVIAPYGDLMLRLFDSDGVVQFRVASQVLCLSSPVFFAMLNPASSFKEANEFRAHPRTSREPYTLSIEDDNRRALTVILYAIHLRNSKVPPIITNREILWHMAVICDKYDFTAALSPWVSVWAEKWKGLVVRHGHWLFIAWTFGLADTFTKVSKGIILEGHYGAGGSFLGARGQELDDLAISESVMG